MDRTRRAVLAGAGAALVGVAGCATRGTYADGGSNGTDGPLPHEFDETVTVERGRWFAHRLPATDYRTFLSYVVTVDADVRFDAYVFDAAGFDDYRDTVRGLDGGSGDGNGSGGDGAAQPDGIAEASVPGASGEASADGVLSAGEYVLVVDYSDYGRPTGATVAPDDPESVEAEVFVRYNSPGFT